MTLPGVNKKLFISIALAAVLLVGALLGFVIIPGALNNFKPVGAYPNEDIRKTVSGNGGNAVMVGDYLYFIGGFISADEITRPGQNEYNKVKGEGALYRVKMPNGTPSFNLEKYDTETYGDKQLVWTNDMELIVPKIAGFEKAALWIFGKTLVYTSPNNLKDKTGTLQTGRVDFFRVDLNGKNHRQVYTSLDTSKNEYESTVVSIDGNVYLLCRDGKKLVCVNVNTGKKTTITEKAASVAFPKVSTYIEGNTASLKASYAGVMGNVYYTETREEDDVFTGDILKQYEISKNKKTVLRKIDTSQLNNHRVLGLSNGQLMFEAWDNSDKESTKIIYVIGNKYDEQTDTVIPALDAEKFRNGVDLGRFTALKTYQSNEEFFLPTEQTNVTPQFISMLGNSILLYTKRGENADNKGNMYDMRDLTPGINVSKIIAVNASYIWFESDDGMRVIDFNGQTPPDTQTTHQTTDRVSEVAISTFYTLNPDGTVNNGVGARFFYIKTVKTKSGDEDEQDETTVACIADLRGNEYILVRLAKEYLEEIE